MKIVKNRQARAGMSAEEFYNLISDLRNFRHLLPADMRDKYRSDELSCEIIIDQAGSLSLQVAGKIPYSKVFYTGSAVSRIKLEMEVLIESEKTDKCIGNLTLACDTDPVTGIVLSSLLDRFLDKMVTEIENYKIGT